MQTSDVHGTCSQTLCDRRSVTCAIRKEENKETCRHFPICRRRRRKSSFVSSSISLCILSLPIQFLFYKSIFSFSARHNHHMRKSHFSSKTMTQNLVVIFAVLFSIDPDSLFKVFEAFDRSQRIRDKSKNEVMGLSYHAKEFGSKYFVLIRFSLSSFVISEWLHRLSLSPKGKYQSKHQNEKRKEKQWRN